MFTKAKTLDASARAAVDAFFAAGGQVTMCPTRRAHARTDGGWGRLNDESRKDLGRATG